MNLNIRYVVEREREREREQGQKDVTDSVIRLNTLHDAQDAAQDAVQRLLKTL
jgi:hypothetical protein